MSGGEISDMYRGVRVTAKALAIPLSSLAIKIMYTFGAHSITRELRINVADEIISIVRRPNKSLAVPAMVVIRVPARNVIETIIPSILGSDSRLNSFLM